VKDHGRVIHDQVLIEVELTDAAGQGYRRIDAVDTVRHFMNVRTGLRVGDHR
jgi:hypothetical protein